MEKLFDEFGGPRRGLGEPLVPVATVRSALLRVAPVGSVQRALNLLLAVVMALAIAGGLQASEPKAAADGAFSVEDGSGRRLGFITMQTVESSLAAGAFRMAVELPDGRAVVVTHRREQGLSWV